MRWAGYLLALAAAVMAGSPDPTLTGDWSSPPFFPDGIVPDLSIRPRQVTRFMESKSACSTCAEPTAANAAGKEDPQWRLSGDIIPHIYLLNIDVNIEKFLFNGTETIDFTPQKATKKIVIHADDLDMFAAPAYVSTGGAIYSRVLSIDKNLKYLTATLNLEKELAAQTKYSLFLVFGGVIRKDLLGFYRSSYKVGDEIRWLATTQFEPTHARRAFPCFDEPNLKAVFYITITHDKKYRAISNMPIYKSTEIGNQVTDSFQPTQPMSTYLVAYIISDFSNYTGNTPRSNIWANEDFIKNAKPTQEYALKTLESMEKYTDIPFALPKMDHAAIPNFDAGAMENWGLITYRDYLLIERNETTTPMKQAIASVIAHEMAHQWFGDLVTMDWWSSTWLNEGFATFFENYVTEEITNGKWALWDQFITAKFQVAMGLDARSETSVAMTSNVSTPEQIAAKFDQITYGKGGCVLRMFSEILKPENFRRALQKYLGLRQFKNAKPEDLFEQLKIVATETSALPKDVDFTAFAKSWTEQDGVPVVTAMRNYEYNQVTMKQKRFYEKSSSRRNERRWWIPLSWNFRNREGTRPDDFKVNAWLHPSDGEVIALGVQSKDWFLLNMRSVGYFRVNYDTRNWLLLTAALNAAPGNFSVANRAQILNDAYSLASADELDFPIALELLKTLIPERSSPVWQSGVTLIAKMFDNIGPTVAYPLYEEFARRLLNETYLFVTLDVDKNEEHLKSLLRYSVASYSCMFGVEKCMKDATEKLRLHQGDASVIHADVITSTVCGGVRAANETEFWRIRKRVSTVARPDVKTYIVAGLTCTTNNTLLRAHLEDAILPNSEFPTEKASSAIQATVTNPSKFTVGFEFLRDRLDKIIEKIGKQETRKNVQALISRIRTKSHHQMVGEWLNKNSNKFDEKEKLLEQWKKAETNTEWNTMHLATVADWLAATVGQEVPPGIPPRPSSSVSHSGSLILAVVLCIVAMFI